MIWAKELINRTNSSYCPPALAFFAGKGTDLFMLYDISGFDLLHCLDPGLARTFPKFPISMFCEAHVPQRKMSKPAIVRLANERFRQHARCFKITFAPLRAAATEVQAFTTGKRRSSVLFLSDALLALQARMLPEEDVILQASLHLSKAH